MPEFRIETDRLVLRSWRDADIAPFHAICSDPVVMATLGPVMDVDRTRALIEAMQSIEAEQGHCFWALERRGDARLIGWCGIITSTVGSIAGNREVGWRLASDCWGQGYASEAARASVDWLFSNRPDDAVWAITAVGNARSRAVMERLGMRYCEGMDFDHPRIPADSPLLAHVTYRLDRSA